jgi:AraC-like DNA-binding protein
MAVTMGLRTDEPATARSGADSWERLLDQGLGPIDPVGVPDRVVLGEVGAVRVGELSQREPGGARRTARHARLAGEELYKVDVLARGRGVVEQGGREASLGPGDLTLVDLSRPARWTMSPVRCVAVVFPRALLPLGPDEVRGLTAVRIPGDRGAGALASSLARQLAGHLDGGAGDYGAAGGARLGTALIDLLTVALAARLERGGMPPDTRRRVLSRHIHAFIEERLGDPTLSPATIATANHVSRRYLYKLFEAERDSVAGWIRRRRLERCRRDLLDPALWDLPVSTIGARWGLPNAAHFSRAFRAAYGIPPAEFRALARGRGPG